ncbi:hypothetical protein [Kribbella pratensis]|uniref:Uncharacterized protein n=1 Tax=Kribbella pratensis TaxID=2512112 RepID=A0A4R8CKN9_9ACTN|nr:hypothetical protein [Kribbella pratensis]TDW76293.1 hypothetical protein EV653_1439 [Kribbella pratensis]
MTEPEIRRWGTHRVTLNLLRLLVLAALVATAIEHILWPTIPATLLILGGAMRYEPKSPAGRRMCVGPGTADQLRRSSTASQCAVRPTDLLADYQPARLHRRASVGCTSRFW